MLLFEAVLVGVGEGLAVRVPLREAALLDELGVGIAEAEGEAETDADAEDGLAAAEATVASPEVTCGLPTWAMPAAAAVIAAVAMAAVTMGARRRARTRGPVAGVGFMYECFPGKVLTFRQGVCGSSHRT